MADTQPNGTGRIHIDDFARRYRIDAAVIRDWIKRGYVDYEMVDSTHIRRTGVHPVIPKKASKPEDKPKGPGWSVSELRQELVGYLLAADSNLTLEQATEMTESMDFDTVKSMLENLIQEAKNA